MRSWVEGAANETPGQPRSPAYDIGGRAELCGRRKPIGIVYAYAQKVSWVRGKDVSVTA